MISIIVVIASASSFVGSGVFALRGVARLLEKAEAKLGI